MTIERNALIGSWSLVAYTETDAETGEVSHPMGETPQGLILYTTDGYMSAQLGVVGRKAFASADPYGGATDEYAAAGTTYLAYSGPFYLDEVTGRLEHEMFVSFFPNWRTQRQVRLARVEGDMLHLAPEAPMPFNGRLKTANLAWRRVQPNL